MFEDKETSTEQRRVSVLLPTKLDIRWRKRVAVYCRVSTQYESQDDSIKQQIDYYRRMVSRNHSWILVDIYVDRKSGRSRTGRTAFNKMIAACMAGEIDMIITKSISRFGRNTVDVLSVLNELRVRRIDVYFELEELHSIDTGNIFLITAIEAMAQAESESISANIKMGIRARLTDPAARIYNRSCYGYTNREDGQLVIVPEQADVVRRIYRLYLDGHSTVSIINELYISYTPSPTGKEKWSKMAVDTILTNEKYTGDVRALKTYVKPESFGKRVQNDVASDSYLCQNHHESIISRDLFQKVQEERRRRSNIIVDENGVRRKSTHYSMKRKNSDQPTPEGTIVD